MLKVTDLVKRYKVSAVDSVAVKGISFDLPAGEFFTLLGPSGCGKTTTLRAVAGLEIPDEGRIEIDGRCVFSSVDNTVVPAHRRPLSMVFQSYAIWPHLSVLRNVMYPLLAAKAGKAQARVKAMEALEVVGLAQVAERMPGELSGGQQQRVALARAIVRNTGLLLLDEPLSNLDAKLRVQMRSEIKAIQKYLGATVLYVTHDQEEAMMMSDRIAVMNAGRIVELGRPADLYARPTQLFTARFMGENNLVPVDLVEQVDGGAVVQASFGRVRTDRCYPGEGAGLSWYLLLRPELIVLEAGESSSTESMPLGDNQLIGEIIETIYLGKISQYRVRIGQSELDVQRTGERPLTMGDQVRVTIPRDDAGVYGVDSAEVSATRSTSYASSVLDKLAETASRVAGTQSASDMTARSQGVSS